jgi:hypothetical protein
MVADNLVELRRVESLYRCRCREYHARLHSFKGRCESEMGVAVNFVSWCRVLKDMYTVLA